MNSQEKELLALTISMDDLIVKLRTDLPTVFARKEVPRLTGNVIASGTLANLSCKGYGPPYMAKSRNAIYERDSFLAWFRVYLEGGIKAVKATYSKN